jgi:hypothetical protein
MPEQYRVKQGDYLAKIARDHGFTDFHTLWNAPENAALRAKRESPNVLLPGDVVTIPDRESKQEEGSTEQRHHFLLKRPTLKLRLALVDAFRQPVRGAHCELRVDGASFELQTDEDGRLEHEISPTAQHADLVVRDADTVLKDVVLPLQIGYLDPIDTLSGQAARLTNLGYLSDAVETGDDPEFRSAVEEFQCDHDLPVDGKCGPITQKKLAASYGC